MNRVLRASCVVVAATLCASLGGGCRAVTGLSDLQFEEDGGSAGGAGGASGSASASSSASSSATGGPVESCLDGIDNDGDGAVDCADSEDCEPLVECVDPIPDGWTGYARIRIAPFTEGGSSPPPCADGSSALVFHTDPTDTVECSACGCAWEGASCSAPEVLCYFNNNDCSTVADFMVKAETEDCISVDPPADVGDSTCQLKSPPYLTDPGSCGVAPAELINPLPWGWDVGVCTSLVTGGGCPGGGLCVPRPDITYPTGACILQEGLVECPEGWGAQRIDVYEGADDTRGCGACECTGSPECVLDGGYDVYDSSNCGGDSVVVETPECTSVGAFFDSMTGSVRPTLASVTEPGCIGGEPTGDLQETGPHTICCR